MCHAELNTDIPPFFPTYEPLPLLCEPYVALPAPNQNKYKPNNNTADCTPLQRPELQNAYGDRVCERDLPPDVDGSNADFRVCPWHHVYCALRSALSHHYCWSQDTLLHSSCLLPFCLLCSQTRPRGP